MAVRYFVRASECPASNCSIKSLMLAAMSSCLVLGFLLSMAEVPWVGAALLMVSLLCCCFCFSCRRGMYLHAERLLAKAGVARRNGEGYLPPGAKRRAERSG